MLPQLIHHARPRPGARPRRRPAVGASRDHGDADIVLTVVLDGTQLGQAVLGPGSALASMRPGSVLVQHTTCEPAVVVQLAEAAHERQVRFLDAALSRHARVTGQASWRRGQRSADQAREQRDVRRSGRPGRRRRASRQRSRALRGTLVEALQASSGASRAMGSGPLLRRRRSRVVDDGVPPSQEASGRTSAAPGSVKDA
jgi:hypothetical protein